MDQFVHALIMGITQGLTEFLPISSSGHLILVPYLLGWKDAFIESLAFSVVVSAGTLLALLAYFRDDWLRLVPAFFASIRDRSLADDPDRRLAWLLVIATVPAAIVAFLLNDFIEKNTRTPGIVAILLVVAGGILWLSDSPGTLRIGPWSLASWGERTHSIDRLTPRSAALIGLAQALALFNGVSRSGISISAGRFAGLDREGATRFSFLMATPITALAVAYEGVKLLRGEVAGAEPMPLVVGIVAAFVSGILAIGVLLRYVRSRSFNIFVAYRFVLAAVVLAVFLTR